MNDKKYIIETKTYDFGDGELVNVEYASNLRGEYIGTPEDAKYLCDNLGIDPECIPGNTVCSIGFSEKDQKWYGWSHRALFGFEIGSEVKKGDCAYIPNTVDDLYEAYVEFFSDVKDSIDIKKYVTKQYYNNTILVSHPPIRIIPQDGSEEILISDTVKEIKTGRGEWKAKTLEDAKQMAIDYAKSVA